MRLLEEDAYTSGDVVFYYDLADELDDGECDDEAPTRPPAEEQSRE